MKLESSREIIETYNYTEFHENPSSRIRAVPCVRADRHADMKKPIIAFCNFAKASKNGSGISCCYLLFSILHLINFVRSEEK
jgi:hypothetical protein